MLIDTPPELRLQLLAAGVSDLDAVWYTHAHADHTHGIDDLRVFSRADRAPLPTYADPTAAESMRQKFGYVFDQDYQPIGGPKKLRGGKEFDFSTGAVLDDVWYDQRPHPTIAGHNEQVQVIKIRFADGATEEFNDKDKPAELGGGD